jgi:hypothetical protein
VGGLAVDGASDGLGGAEDLLDGEAPHDIIDQINDGDLEVPDD